MYLLSRQYGKRIEVSTHAPIIESLLPPLKYTPLTLLHFTDVSEVICASGYIKGVFGGSIRL